MGPRLDSRGREGYPCRSWRSKASFNGAAAGQPRKGHPSSPGTSSTSASMGPRLDSRGRVNSRSFLAGLRPLQWGRGWTAAEGGSGSTACC